MDRTNDPVTLGYATGGNDDAPSTRTNVAALAAALPNALSLATEQDSTYGYSDEPGSPYVRFLAEAIIAALAAQGWRITSAPEPPVDPDKARPVLADDPVSAQAAPGYATGGNDDAPSTRTQASPAVEALQEWVRNLVSEREQAAVRAALEGLRAEVDAIPREGRGYGLYIRWHAVRKAIEDRLAALPS